LVSNEFVQQQINMMKDINQDSVEYETVQTLFKKKENIFTDTYAVFFNKVVALMGEMRGKTKEEIVDVLRFVNPYIDLINNRVLDNEPRDLYNLIVNDRKIPHVNSPYSNNPQYDQNRNFIDECITEQNNISDIMDFVIGVYRITESKTDTIKEIEKLLKSNRDEMNKKSVELIEIGFTLKPILSLIFQDTNYENKNTIALLRHCFNQKNNTDNYYLSESDITDKLKNILDYAITKQNNSIFELLESLVEQQFYRELLSNLITGLSGNEINSLPPKLLELALSSFSGENYEDFNNNFEFLSVIASCGDINHKKLLIKILIQKINNDSDVDMVLNIIDLINNIYEIDPDNLLSTHLKKYMRESTDDELKSHIGKILKRNQKIEDKTTKIE
jgi:hypothetical protein